MALDNNSMLHFILDIFHITMKYFAAVKTGVVEDSNGSLHWSINEIVVEWAATSVVKRVTTSNLRLWTLEKASSLDLERSALLRVKDILFWCVALADL